MSSPPPPSGTLCFLFTDIEGSTQLWESHETAMREALATHDGIIRDEVAAHGGYVFSTAGDSFSVAFERVDSAVDAATAIHGRLTSASWATPLPLRVRIGIHVGEAQERDGDYFGPTLNRTARIMSAAHGGQTVMSNTAAALAHSQLQLIDLGEHRLKDLQVPERLWQTESDEFPPLRTLDRHRHNLTTERTALLGRDGDIGELAKLLAEHRLISLLGIGGSGKTRLAIAAGAETIDQFSDGVWFVDLVPASSEDDVVTAIADATGLSPGGRDLLGGLAMAIRTRELLLILDNCEHITDIVADVVDVLLEDTDTPKLFITSREPLGFVEEQQFPVTPLSMTDDYGPAVELLVAAAERAGAEIEPGMTRELNEIVEKLDGHPLSLELAAAQLRQLTPSELNGRLDQRFELLEQRRRGSRQSHRQRQASLLAVLADTCALLNDAEHELLLLLAAFPSSFGADDVEGIAKGAAVSVPVRTLSGLVDRGLVANSGAGRHRLLETVKLFAREQWTDDAVPCRFREAHSRYIIEHLETHQPEDRYVDYGMVKWIHDRYDDVRAIEDHLTESGQFEQLGRVYSLTALAAQALDGTRASALIERATKLVGVEAIDAVAKAHISLTIAHAALPARRPEWFEEGSFSVLDELDPDRHPEAVADALVIHSWPLAFSDLHRSLRVLRRSQEIADSAGAHRLGTVALAYATNHLLLAGRQSDSVEWQAEVDERLPNERVGYQTSVNCTNIFKSTILTDPGTALEEINRSEALITELGGADWGWRLASLVAHGSLGNTSELREGFPDFDELTRRTRSDGGLPDNLLPLATLAWRLGDTGRAQRWLTAIREAPAPTQNFNLTAVFRQLRSELGLTSDNPLDGASIEDILAEARRWLDDLDTDSNTGRAHGPSSGC